MNLLSGAEIKCPLSVFERVRIIDFFPKENVRILLGHRRLSIIERCPQGEVRLYNRRSGQ